MLELAMALVTTIGMTFLQVCLGKKRLLQKEFYSIVGIPEVERLNWSVNKITVRKLSFRIDSIASSPWKIDR